MPPVFAHGRLRLYLLKLLDEAPRHGYEIIRLLEERFQGLYAPSAGTVYPRLAKLSDEGLVTHATEGGRKVYSITEAGRAELAARGGELAELELEIRESVAALASDIREDVSGSARDLRREMREAAQAARRQTARNGRPGGTDSPGPSEAFDRGPDDPDAWRHAKEEFRRAKEEWKEQARRAKEESRRAKQEAQRARKQAKNAKDSAREEVQEVIRRMQERAQEQVRSGDWPGAVRDVLSEVSREVGRFTDGFAAASGTPGPTASGTTGSAASGTAGPAPAEPAWAHEPATGDPARDLDRLLDRFRDDLRDAARDHGVDETQLAAARQHLATAAAHIGALLRRPPQ
ncbi:PadR family transcriptional regulator [Streptomyces purpurogeneiscleroticus]|uniref:PadR family transcriptional regulator n=1 Tax=Streptomyces purpurogeneiscleroticus TaxID=68259 RepID=UPI001CBFDA0A|nr:PadR family transcriptional regulator [Streptomyces purpurogeneiscleroticus]MBZ4016860.1 PadR family transcriptional regulator [Streptomyces purpurogeneiscleroticus]